MSYQRGKPKQPAVYILASRRNGTVYTGVTSGLFGRIAVHQQDLIDGFTKRYGVHRLVHFELFDTMPEAITREKQIKKYGRARKLALIETGNPGWADLYEGEFWGEGVGSRWRAESLAGSPTCARFAHWSKMTGRGAVRRKVDARRGLG